MALLAWRVLLSVQPLLWRCYQMEEKQLVSGQAPPSTSTPCTARLLQTYTATHGLQVEAAWVCAQALRSESHERQHSRHCGCQKQRLAQCLHRSTAGCRAWRRAAASCCRHCPRAAAGCICCTCCICWCVCGACCCGCRPSAARHCLIASRSAIASDWGCTRTACRRCSRGESCR